MSYAAAIRVRLVTRKQKGLKIHLVKLISIKHLILLTGVFSRILTSPKFLHSIRGTLHNS